MLRLSAFACLAATAASALQALRPMPMQVSALKVNTVFKRSRKIVAQSGWVPVVDDSSGQIYYLNEQTGESQWEQPGATTAQKAQNAQWESPGATPQQAPSSWAPVVDEASGHTYYLNEQTGESQWEPPAEFAQWGASAQGVGAPVLWRLAGMAFRNHLNEESGVVGFTGVAGFPGAELSYDYELDYAALPYTLRDGEEQLLGRWNMVEQQLTVSRIQAVVACADGHATLRSVGRGATLWRQRGSTWVALQDGESVGLTDGDQISLDCNDSEAAVFTCEDVLKDGYRDAPQAGYY